MIVVDCEQGTDEWLECRRGIPTASEFKKIVTTKGKRSKQQSEYIYRLASERILGRIQEQYISPAMLLGHEHEIMARSQYEWEREIDVKEIGFSYKDELKIFGCSPDGLIGEDGMIEIKSALPKIHLERICNDWNGKQSSYKDHWQQVQGQLFVCERQWCDLISYSPDMKLAIKRIEPDAKFLECLEEELLLMNENILEILRKYESM